MAPSIVRDQSRVNDPVVRGQSRGQPHLDPLSDQSRVNDPIVRGSHVTVPAVPGRLPNSPYYTTADVRRMEAAHREKKRKCDVCLIF